MGAGQGQDLDRIVGDPGLAQGFAGGEEFGLEVQQPADRALRRRLGAHALSRLARLGAEDARQGREPGVGGRGDAHGVGDLAVVGRTGLHGLGHAVPFGGIDPGDEVLFQLFGAAVGLGAGQGVGIGRGSGLSPVDIVQQVGALGLDHRQQGLEPLPVQFDGEMAVGQADGTVGSGDGGAGQVLARGMAEGGGGLVFQHGEAGRDPGLEREATQQFFAEGVDGLDLQPARRLQRAGEQFAGAGQGRVIHRLRVAVVQPGQFARQGGVVQHGPAAQLVEQPGLHLGGGGLGVGDAQDGAGIDLVQQQPRHPVDQGGGLARAGVGGDEDGQARVGRDDLGGHAHSSSPSPITDHSQTRAR